MTKQTKPCDTAKRIDRTLKEVRDAKEQLKKEKEKKEDWDGDRYH